jgi:superfamily II DNA or RNA helicase
MFKNMSWKGVYRTDTDNLLEDFYLPALSQSIAYDRAVGYFSASMLSFAAQGIAALVENDGRMRLIFGGEIDDIDAKAINEGYDLRNLTEKIGQGFLKTIEDVGHALTTQRLETLSWLIAQGKLDIKIALKRRGMYHEKIGIFTDKNDDRLVFQGSANETTYALLPDFNFESINLFPVWRTELKDHYQPYIDGFERLWLNETKDTCVIDFPEAAREKLIKIMVRQQRSPKVEIELELWKKLNDSKINTDVIEKGLPAVPKTYKGSAFDLVVHQRAALNAWKSQSFNGILAMATGSGKTLTAIYGLVKLFESTKKLFLIIAVPYQALADQWLDELAGFSISAIPCYQSKGEWEERLSEEVNLFEAGAQKFAACVVVNKTLTSDNFQQRIKRISGEHLAFVGDECHHHAAREVSNALPLHARIRLGLSATPKHYFDEARSDLLIKYYGQIVYEYNMEQALKDGVLTPYKYYVHLVELTDIETEEYLELTEKISKVAAGGNFDDTDSIQNDQLKLLLFKRTRLLGNAQNKLLKLQELLSETKPSPYHLFYCGDGIDDDEISGLSRQVDKVSRLLYENNWKVSHFTSREDARVRKLTLDNFRIGLLDALVAIRCLDEGVDIPDCRTAYILASSRNPKQFIQRRGRILRRSPNKEFAIVHDLLIKLPDGSTPALNTSRKLVLAELTRVAEFGRLSSNRAEVYQTLLTLLNQFDLQHHFI